MGVFGAKGIHPPYGLSLMFCFVGDESRRALNLMFVETPLLLADIN